MKILNIKVDNITYKETISKIEDFIKSKKPHQICTVNPEFIMAAQKNKAFMSILNNADLCVPDGAGLLWASRYLSKKLKSYPPATPERSDGGRGNLKPIEERVTGVDLILKIAELAEKNGYTIYLLGALPGVAEQTAITLRTKYPELKIVGVSEGIPQFTSGRTPIIDVRKYENNLVTQISNLKPDILLVAYGAPKQDQFIAKYKKTLGIPVMIGVGGSFDYISGRTPRAPIWIQKIWLEWLYRLITMPRRLNRIITATIRFPWKVISSTRQKQS